MGLSMAGGWRGPTTGRLACCAVLRCAGERGAGHGGWVGGAPAALPRSLCCGPARWLPTPGWQSGARTPATRPTLPTQHAPSPACSPTAPRPRRRCPRSAGRQQRAGGLLAAGGLPDAAPVGGGRGHGGVGLPAARARPHHRGCARGRGCAAGCGLPAVWMSAARCRAAGAVGAHAPSAPNPGSASPRARQRSAGTNPRSLPTTPPLPPPPRPRQPSCGRTAAR